VNSWPNSGLTRSATADIDFHVAFPSFQWMPARRAKQFHIQTFMHKVYYNEASTNPSLVGKGAIV
jgi:hypothetical protein